MSTEPERWRQAALWRSVAAERLTVAIDALTDAVAGMPLSEERGRAEAALAKSHGARRLCRSGAATARSRIEGNA